jgi:hypothetical protein
MERKTKTAVFKKGGKLSRDEKLWFRGRSDKGSEGNKYLGVVLDIGGKWEKDRKQVVIKGK